MGYARIADDPRDLVAPPARRRLAPFIAAVTAAFEAAFAVIDEATDQSAAARRRFPAAD